ncbi:MAG: bestrophin family protein [Sphingobium sp.]|nr:bestrophin family protein [Sphingobium sp.]
MIVRDRPRVHELLFALRGSIVPLIAPGVLVLMVFAAAMVWLHDNLALFPSIDGIGFTVFGIALSLFLGFRNNAAYDRWWEARRLWGGLLADMRSFAREVDIFVQDAALRERLLEGALAFLHLHRTNLRGIENDATARALGGALADAAHPPAAALDVLASEIAQARRADIVDGFGAMTLSQRIASMSLQQTGCERIAATPLPYVYSLLIYRTAYLYCLLLPIALIGPAGWMTPVFVGIVGYVFLGLAEVSEELSHPFGTTQNALPLDAICRSAEISIAPHLGRTPPEPLAAVDYYLS